MKDKPAEPQVKLETKNVKHIFTDAELKGLGDSLARTIGAKRGVEAEFDQVKASFKSRLTESEARIDRLSTDLVNGFEMRDKKCMVIFRPKDKQKDYYLEYSDINGATGLPKGLPILTEDMTKDDYQTDLIQAESKFDLKEEIQLFSPTESDSGILAVGKIAGKWFTALRVRIGKLELSERLDTEQRAFVKRPDAVTFAVGRFQKWAKENLKGLADGFQSTAQGVIEAHKERAE